VRSKSEVIIANILTYLGIDFEYEKPLFSKSDPEERRVPDFTIKHNGKEYYLEALSLSSPEYRRLWQRKKKWYEENDYSDRLIVTKEKADGIDSKEIENLIREKILKQNLNP
jgi:predicted nuclease of restriction endonuclease-like RecB superfamily